MIEANKAIEVLRKHNLWRRGDESIDMIAPRELGIAIEVLCDEFEKKKLTNANLNILIRRMARKLPDDDKVKQQALEYLRRISTSADILREQEGIGKVEQS